MFFFFLQLWKCYQYFLILRVQAYKNKHFQKMD